MKMRGQKGGSLHSVDRLWGLELLLFLLHVQSDSSAAASTIENKRRRVGQCSAPRRDMMHVYRFECTVGLSVQSPRIPPIDQYYCKDQNRFYCRVLCNVDGTNTVGVRTNACVKWIIVPRRILRILMLVNVASRCLHHTRWGLPALHACRHASR
jgi:hypothetical protein